MGSTADGTTKSIVEVARIMQAYTLNIIRRVWQIIPHSAVYT